MNVTLKNYSITVSGGTTLAAGTYTFHVSNSGPSSHNLTINGPGVSNQTTGTFAPGGTADLTVTLKNGTYDFYCSVPGHKQLGMNVNVTVGTYCVDYPAHSVYVSDDPSAVVVTYARVPAAFSNAVGVQFSHRP